MNIPLSDLTGVFARIGLLSFGGPAAQIALMHKTLVDERAWLSEQAFLRALSFCMLLPGPEAMQLATYAGWRLRGVPGGLIAGLLFVLPGAVVIMALALAYARVGDLAWVQALFLGVKAVVVVIVIEALIKVARRALSGWMHWMLAGAAFVGLYVFALPFPLVIAGAGLVGFWTAAPDTAASASPPTHNPLPAIAAWLVIWLVPLGIVYAIDPAFLGPLGVFFSKLAVVTFGGAYAVLAYMAQTVVTDFGWLSTAQMMDALGLAETTPGPLILVTEFVAVLAGYAQGGIGLAVAAGFLALWTTFAPCFLWIFAGAPYIDRLAAHPRLAAGLSAITAAVVGVILNLSLWFAVNVFFGSSTLDTFGPAQVLLPEPASANLVAIALAVVAGYLMLIRNVSMFWVLGLAAVAGLVLERVA